MSVPTVSQWLGVLEVTGQILLVPGRNGALQFVECKAGRTVTPQMAVPLRRLAAAVR